MPPGDSVAEKTAPQPLELVQRFVNSVDLETGDDELGRPEELRDWLADRDLIGRDERVTRADLERALDVREGLRALLLANNGLAADAERWSAWTAQPRGRACGWCSAPAPSRGWHRRRAAWTARSPGCWRSWPGRSSRAAGGA